MKKFLKALFAITLISGCGSNPAATPGVVTPDPTSTPGTTTYTVTAAGAPSSYAIGGVANPALTLVRGQTYVFNLSVAGHPFYIMSVQGTNIANAYTSGVTGNGSTSGTLTFVVPSNAPNTLYYDCSIHSSMTGTITVTN